LQGIDQIAVTVHHSFLIVVLAIQANY